MELTEILSKRQISKFLKLKEDVLHAFRTREKSDQVPADRFIKYERKILGLNITSLLVVIRTVQNILIEENSVFGQKIPLLTKHWYHKFDNMVIFRAGNLYSLCSPGNQDYQKIIHFNFFITIGRNRRFLLELVVIINESRYNQAYIFDYRTLVADFDIF